MLHNQLLQALLQVHSSAPHPNLLLISPYLMSTAPCPEASPTKAPESATAALGVEARQLQGQGTDLDRRRGRQGQLMACKAKPVLHFASHLHLDPWLSPGQQQGQVPT